MAPFGSAALVREAFPSMVTSGLRMPTAFAVLAVRRTSSGSPMSYLRRRDRLLLAGMAAIGTVGFTLPLSYLLLGKSFTWIHAVGMAAAVVAYGDARPS